MPAVAALAARRRTSLRSLNLAFAGSAQELRARTQALLDAHHAGLGAIQPPSGAEAGAASRSRAEQVLAWVASAASATFHCCRFL